MTFHCIRFKEPFFQPLIILGARVAKVIKTYPHLRGIYSLKEKWYLNSSISDNMVSSQTYLQGSTGI